MSIPQGEWKWYGAPLHFVAATKCRFRLGTVVGEYVISTVGDYWSSDGKREPVGCERWAETYVFRIASWRSCGCPQIDCSEIDATCYGEDAKCEEINAGHLAMCQKYAEL